MNHNLTKSEIEKSADAYGLVADQLHELRIAHGAAFMDTLQENERRILHFFDLDSECHNGGFCQYLSNRTESDGRLLDEVHQVANALDGTGALKVGEIVRRATVSWCELLKEFPHGGAEFFEKVESRINLFDAQFYEIYDETTVIVSDFIRVHADDFCDTHDS